MVKLLKNIHVNLYYDNDNDDKSNYYYYYYVVKFLISDFAETRTLSTCTYEYAYYVSHVDVSGFLMTFEGNYEEELPLCA